MDERILDFLSAFGAATASRIGLDRDGWFRCRASGQCRVLANAEGDFEEEIRTVNEV